MTSPQSAQPAGSITQQIRKFAPDGEDSAQAQFLPDLCHVSALAVLVLMGELLALVLVLAVDGLRDFSWQRLGLVSLAVQWVILPSAALLCRLRPRLAQLSHRVAGAISFAVVMAVLLAVLVVQEWLRASLMRQGFDLWHLLDNTLLGAICAGVVLRYAYVQQQLHNQQRAELVARIDALQSRIRPHFLFNSMNSLASLIAIDPERAEKLVEDLSTLFRASLADSKMVPLEQELTLARRYLQIEALRLGERLRQSWDIDSGLESAVIPSMLLQPLLENAVLHGVARLKQGGEIQVYLRQLDNQLQLVIENPAPALDSNRERRGNGMALENIRQRLAAHYGHRYRFQSELEDGIYRVEVILPMNNIPETGKRSEKMEPAL
ncbi:Sensor histidine kinase YpdA [Microbulbifer aggregans]|uniref:Sensor histidine kinase YpdA n=1 Tax=Microbulbifer aggregans TaxID=1769779 RepID=A0A1C9W611_9GAMM|nr:sensor histidine kinase [Microbulbifer aggregans]AOS96573.1 Sensor histidine kinase YpdA [Microbulbifer aggregans]